jgi:hypothetical protein
VTPKDFFKTVGVNFLNSFSKIVALMTLIFFKKQPQMSLK